MAPSAMSPLSEAQTHGQRMLCLSAARPRAGPVQAAVRSEAVFASTLPYPVQVQLFQRVLSERLPLVGFDEAGDYDDEDGPVVVALPDDAPE